MGAATTADRNKHGWAVPRVPVSGSDVLPIHIGVTLLGSPGDAHLRYIASDALLASAEAAGAVGTLSRRRWRSREARLLGEALATADRHRDEFLAVLSHELRSPLAAIRNAVHIVGSLATEAPARRRAQALLERQLQRVTRLVDEILDLSRLTLGRVPLNCERMDLRTAVNNAIETLETEIHERLHTSGRSSRGGIPGFRNRHRGARNAVHIRSFQADGRRRSAFRYRPRGRSRVGARVRQGARGSVMVRSAGQGRGSEFAVQLPTEG